MRNKWRKNRRKNKITIIPVRYRSLSFLLISLLTGVVLFSCSNRPKSVLSKKEMERLLYDVYVAESMMERDYENFDTPEKKEAYIHKIFKAHKITQAQWDTSLSWYSDRIDLYLKINDTVKVRLQRQQQEIEAAMERQRKRMTIDPATLLPSYIPPSFSYDEPNVKNGFTFHWDWVEVAQKLTTDSFYFAYRVIGVPRDSLSQLSSMLALTYGDTTIYSFRKIAEEGEYCFPAAKYIELDSVRRDTLSEINGFVRWRDRFGKKPPILLHGIRLEERNKAVTDSLASPPEDEAAVELLQEEQDE